MGKFKPPVKVRKFSKSTTTVETTESYDSYSTESFETTVPSHVTTIDWPVVDYEILQYNFKDVLPQQRDYQVASLNILRRILMREISSHQVQMQLIKGLYAKIKEKSRPIQENKV